MASVQRVARHVMLVSLWLPLVSGACGSSSSGPGEGAAGGSAGRPPAGTATGGSRSTGGSPGTGGGPATGGSTGGSSPAGTAGTPGSGGAPGTGGAGGAGGAGAGTGGAAGGRGGSGGSAGTAGNGTGAGGSAGTGGPSGGGGAHSGPWKVMMLGDSVTQSTCYPQLTYEQIKAGGHTNFEFVGSKTTSQSCGSGAPSSIKDEGHAGYGVTYLPANSTRGACGKSSGCGSYAELQTWAAEKPEIVLMHFGTNDVWDGVPTATIVAAYVAVISEFRKQNPNVIFFVSKIIKLSPSGCGSCLNNVAALANAVTPAWASANAMPTSPIFIVDHYDSAFSPTNSADTSDGVHPTPTGAAIMAKVTADALAAANYF